MDIVTHETLLDRMVRAVEQVRERLLRAAGALEAAGIPYAVVGGNAIAAWVATVDRAAVRNTQDVDILLRRKDLEAAKHALQTMGFVHHEVAGVDVFLDGPQANIRDAIHVIFAGEKVREDYTTAAPDVDECQRTDQFRLVALEALVKMKLTSFRRKDQVHIQDLLEIGLIDESWLAKLPAELGARLRHLIDTPEG